MEVKWLNRRERRKNKRARGVKSTQSQAVETWSTSTVKRVHQWLHVIFYFFFCFFFIHFIRYKFSVVPSFIYAWVFFVCFFIVPLSFSDSQCATDAFHRNYYEIDKDHFHFFSFIHFSVCMPRTCMCACANESTNVQTHRKRQKHLNGKK